VTILLGVDTLCWHMPLEAGEVSVESVLAEAAELGAAGVALNLHHVRDRGDAGVTALAATAGDLGLRLAAQGDFVGAARHGDRVEAGVERVARWLERAVLIGSPTLRVASGFYRAELAGQPDVIDQERAFVTAVLEGSAAAAEAAGITLLLENHSDFSVAEYERIVQEVGPDRVGVFLDLINPIMTFDDPYPAIARLAPLAPCGHVRDYLLESNQQPDSYHRRGFTVHYRYPGEGQADLASLVGALRAALRGREYLLFVEGLDSSSGVHDQAGRLARSFELLRTLTANGGGA